MKPKDIIELIEEINEKALTMDGFDDAIIGIVDRYGMESVLLYDWQKCIKILIDGGCEDAEEAEEYLHFNCLGAWLGDGTPAFANMSCEMENE